MTEITPYFKARFCDPIYYFRPVEAGGAKRPDGAVQGGPAAAAADGAPRAVQAAAGAAQAGEQDGPEQEHQPGYEQEPCGNGQKSWLRNEQEHWLRARQDGVDQKLRYWDKFPKPRSRTAHAGFEQGQPGFGAPNEPRARADKEPGVGAQYEYRDWQEPRLRAYKEPGFGTR